MSRVFVATRDRARPARRGEGAPARARGRRERRPVPPRDPARRAAPAPAHRAAARRRRGRRPAVLHHAVRRRRIAARRGSPRRRAAGARGGPHPARRRARAGLRARQRRRAPRHQARQRAALRRRRGGHRLRRRQGAQRLRPASQRTRGSRRIGVDARHAGLHGAGAGLAPIPTPITAPTSTRSASWPTRCSPASRRSPGARRRRCSRARGRVPEPSTAAGPTSRRRSRRWSCGCLEKRPADRPQSAGEVMHVLDTLTTPSGGTVPVYAATDPGAQIRRVEDAAARAPGHDPPGDRSRGRVRRVDLGARARERSRPRTRRRRPRRSRRP